MRVTAAVGRRRRQMYETPQTMTYYYLEGAGDLVFCVPWFRREGLCLFLYNDHELAKAAAEEKSRHFGYEISLEETADPIGFLRTLANRGFAGAVLNDLVPLIFCTDSSGRYRFLRMFRRPDGDPGRFEMLDEDGTWAAVPDLDEVTPTRDQPRFDRLMREMIGIRPFRGYTPGWKAMTYSVVGSQDVPFIDTDADPEQGEEAATPTRFVPIFSAFAFMEAFVTARGLDPATLYRRDVEDLAALVALAERRDAVILLNPGQHRVDMAAMLMAGGRIALRSFSGRWISSDGKEFRRTDEGKTDAAREIEADGPKTLAQEMAEMRAAGGSVGGEAEGSPAGAVESAPIPDEEPEPDGFPLPSELGEVVFDLSRDEVEIRMDREEVENGRMTMALSFLCSSFRDSETLRWAQGRFCFRFNGFPESGPVFTIPSVRRWLQALDRLFPVLPYFLREGGEGQQLMAAALLHRSVEAGRPVFDRDELHTYVVDRCLMIGSMGEKYGVDSREACIRFAAALDVELPERFFLPGGEGEPRA